MNETNKHNERLSLAPPAGYVGSAIGAEVNMYSFPALAAIAARRKGLILITAATVLTATFAAVLLSHKTYESELKLMLKRSRLDSPEAAGAIRQADVSESELSAEIELIKNPELMAKVVDRCRLAPLDGPSEAGRGRVIALAVRDLEKNLKIGPIGKTNLISIKYASENPQRAANVVNTVANLYLEKHMAVHRNRDTAEFFRNQADLYDRELVSAQAQFSRFRQRHAVSLLEVQKQNNLRRVTEMEASLQEGEAQIRDAQDRAGLLRRQRTAMPANIETQSRIARSVGLLEKLKGQLLDLENKRTELLTKYEPGYRLVKEIEKQIQDTRTALEGEQHPSVVDQTQSLNPLRQSIESDLLHTETQIAGWKARRANVAREFAGYRARQQSLEGVTMEHDDLQRRIKLAEENYLLYQRKKEESRLADALDQQRILNVAVVESAVPPALPKDRHRSFTLLLGLVLAVFASLGAALLAEFAAGPAPWVPGLLNFTELPSWANMTTVTSEDAKFRREKINEADPVESAYVRETRELVRQIRSSYVGCKVS